MYSSIRGTKLLSSDGKNSISQDNHYSLGMDEFNFDDIDDIYHRGPGDRNYRTMMWAGLATLVALLLVICLILMLVWRYFRNKLRVYQHQSLETDGDNVVLPEKMPLQPEDSCDTDFRPSELEKSPNHICNAQEFVNHSEENSHNSQEILSDIQKDTKILHADQL